MGTDASDVCRFGGSGGAAGVSTTGRYAGRKAAGYARVASEPMADRNQIDEEKAHAYAPVEREHGVGWRELHAYAGLLR